MDHFVSVERVYLLLNDYLVHDNITRATQERQTRHSLSLNRGTELGVKGEVG